MEQYVADASAADVLWCLLWCVEVVKAASSFDHADSPVDASTQSEARREKRLVSMVYGSERVRQCCQFYQRGKNREEGGQQSKMKAKRW